MFSCCRTNFAGVKKTGMRVIEPREKNPIAKASDLRADKAGADIYEASGVEDKESEIERERERQIL